MFNVCFYFIVIKTYKNHNNNIFRHNIPRKSFVLSLFFHIIAKFHLLAVMWFHLIIRYCIFCNEFQKLISVSILLLKVYKNKIYSIFLLQLHKAEEAKRHHSQYHTSGHSRRPTSWCSCRASRSSGTWPLTQSCNVRDGSMQG